MHRGRQNREMTALQLPNLKLIEPIGKGGMATVWKATQISLDRPVAVKILSDAFSKEQEDIDRFILEAKACARFQHPGIVRVYDANAVDGVYYFVMELITGYTMGEYMARKEKVPQDDGLVILESVANALNYAWKKFRVVHCDIKPDNIMVDADGTVKITDLGLSRSIFAARGTQSADGDEIMGTPAYMSPDQIYDFPDIDCRSDIYSLGATLYHMLSGTMLFEGKTDDDMVRAHIDPFFARDIRLIEPEISYSFAVMLNRMLAKNREYRYPDWETLLVDLTLLYKGSVLRATPLPPGQSSMIIK